MIKQFCDICNGELTAESPNRADSANRLIRELTAGKCTIRVEVLVSKDGINNRGEVCLSCLLNILNHGKDVEIDFREKVRKSTLS